MIRTILDCNQSMHERRVILVMIGAIEIKKLIIVKVQNLQQMTSRTRHTEKI